MGEREKYIQILVTHHFRDLGIEGRVIVKHLKEIGCEVADRIQPVRTGTSDGF